MHLYEGNFAAASSLIDEAGAIAEATGIQLTPYAPVALAAYRGCERQACELIETSATYLERRGREGV
jgi:hypothetical protein